MIIQGNNSVIERNGGSNERRFTMEANSKAFKILSDTLYTDKPKAVIRELACNAYDAHVAAGKEDVPFSVHLPNTLEPWLTIRDYGIGLTPEEIGGEYKDVIEADGSVSKVFVGGIYNTFFKSSETNSNAFIGALGLGSKSPLSYVDSFTVISRKDGMKYSFTAYKNEHGEPEIAELGREPTDEENGLEVSMPVRKSDYTQFSRTATGVLQWFVPQPIVTGSASYEVAETKPLMFTPDWEIYTVAPYGVYRGAVAIQGKVAYPIDWAALQHAATKSQLTIINGPFILRFPIGELDFTASRETLSYDKTTISNILKMTDKVSQELQVEAQKAIDECQNIWDARVKFNKLINNNQVMTSLLYDKSIKIKWRGINLEIGQNVFSIDKTKYPSLKIAFAKPEGKVSNYDFSIPNDVKILTLPAAEDCGVYLQDTKNGGIGRVKQHIKSKNKVGRYNLMVSGTDAHVAAFLKELDGITVGKVSELPKVATRQRTSTTTTTRSLAIMSFDDYEFVAYELDEEDLEEGGFFIPLDKNRPVGKNGVIGVSTFRSIMQWAKQVGLDEDVLGVNKSAIKKFVDNPKWINILDVIDAHVTNLLVDPVLKNSVLASTNDYHLSHNERYSWVRNVTLESIKNQFPPSHALIRYKGQVDVKTGLVNAVSALVDRLSIKCVADANDKINSSSNLFDELNKTYPLLTHMPFNWVPDEKERTKCICQYIKMIDANIAIHA